MGSKHADNRYQEKHCLFCGKNEKIESLYPQTFDEDQLTPATFSARRATEHFHYEIVRCRGCGLVFSRRLLPQEKILELYSQSTVNFSEYVDVLRRDYWSPLAGFAEKLRGGRALEIGCSSGFFLEELLDRGVGSVVGFEPSREAREKAAPRVRDSIVTGFFEGAQRDAEATFDLACSFHTLDHVSDPTSVVASCRTALRPGGLIYLVTHDVRALQARVLGEKSPIFDVEHVYLFDQTTLPRMLAEQGFDIVAAGPLRNSYPIRYWAHMLPVPSPLKRGLSTGLRFSGLGNWAPSISAGNIFAIGRRRA